MDSSPAAAVSLCPRVLSVASNERERIVASIGDKRVVILRNHGLLTWGETLEEAFMWLWLLQRACEIQVAAASVGRLRKLAKVCRAAFDALVRKVDAVVTPSNS